jgi:hypothetical protein
MIRTSVSNVENLAYDAVITYTEGMIGLAFRLGISKTERLAILYYLGILGDDSDEVAPARERVMMITLDVGEAARIAELMCKSEEWPAFAQRVAMLEKQCLGRSTDNGQPPSEIA